MAFVDYYKILGVDKTATEKDIKVAYRKLARKYHPDLNPNDTGANQKFQELNEANEVLTDTDKRKKYDQYGENWQHADAYEQQAKQQQSRNYSGYSGGGAKGRYNSESFDGESGDFSDFFQSMFGNAGGKQQAKYRGQDLNAELKLSLLDAATTQKQTLTVNGRNIRITIPAGVENGQTIKVAGHGNPGVNGGPAGDLYITFLIADDARFKRRGSDLLTNVPLNLYTAILGGEITADTLTGQVKVKVSPETQSGTQVKLKGKGFPVYKKEGVFGDLYLTYNVQLPIKLTPEQKALFEKLAKS